MDFKLIHYDITTPLSKMLATSASVQTIVTLAFVGDSDQLVQVDNLYGIQPRRSPCTQALGVALLAL